MKPGIYFILHEKSKSIYIGQSNNTTKRLHQHKTQLQKNSHHNLNLQNLWNKSYENEFLFLIYDEAQQNLTSLELQRWLVKAERECINHFKNDLKILNRYKPNIVATNKAKDEYEKEKEKKAREQNK